ncbi:GntR family transcriptional regulator, partial [Mycolicibacter minnesotensis]|uniref:GntR family transcriptional regulator n=1 Tax=Mycolicibacter minnesotensis TaxID=1118379 RepID=UPI0021F342B6
MNCRSRPTCNSMRRLASSASLLSGELVEGTPLPAERELVKQTQMSRATVREALRILEVQNLV